MKANLTASLYCGALSIGDCDQSSASQIGAASRFTSRPIQYMHRLLTALAAARFLRTLEAARFLVLSPRTLEKRRCSGGRPEVLEAWRPCHLCAQPLEDRPRPGKEPTITAEAKAWLVSLACQKPKELGYPHELWTTRLLARHAREHGPAAGHQCVASRARSAKS
jgi:hypothetical protein